MFETELPKGLQVVIDYCYRLLFMDYDPLVELYDLQYANYRDDIPFYVRLADDFGSPILELGAGTGRVTAALARAGHQITAVDLSGEMLQKAESYLNKEGVSNQVNLQQADMRHFRAEEKYPLVIAPFNTLMHAYTIKDQDETLATVKHHLEDGGHFAFDLYNPNFNELNILRREAEWQNLDGNASDLFIVQENDTDKQLLTSHYYLDSSNTEGVLTRKRYHLKQRYYHRFEIERALQHAGFSQLTLYGNFSKDRYTVESSHMLAIAY